LGFLFLLFLITQTSFSFEHYLLLHSYSFLHLLSPSVCFYFTSYLRPYNISQLTIECIKHVENNLSKFQHYNFSTMFRSRICSFINQIKYIDGLRTETDVEILKSLHITKTFIKNNPNTVVALDRLDYLIKWKFFYRTKTHILCYNGTLLANYL